VVTALLWIFPNLSSSILSLIPFASDNTIRMADSNSIEDNNPLKKTTSLEKNNSNNTTNNSEKIDRELSPFEKEIKQRHDSYQTKNYLYEPYQLEVKRNPFKLASQYYGNTKDNLEEEKIIEKPEISEYSTELEMHPKDFAKKELKLTGIVSLYDEFVAIIKIQEEYFVVNKNELILGTYFITEINEKNVTIKFENDELVLKLE
jgi:hypothetical protein